jgi:hypothetical protein
MQTITDYSILSIKMKFSFNFLYLSKMAFIPTLEGLTRALDVNDQMYISLSYKCVDEIKKFINEYNRRGLTLLMEAMVKDNDEFMIFLLENGANPNIPNQVTGETPFDMMIRLGEYRIALILTKYGAAGKTSLDALLKDAKKEMDGEKDLWKFIAFNPDVLISQYVEYIMNDSDSDSDSDSE